MSSSSDGRRPQGFFPRGKFLEKLLKHVPQSWHGFFSWFCVHRVSGFLWFAVYWAMNVHI